MIPAVILAGGLGTRIRAVSGDLPKPMIPVAGRPFIEYILDALVDAQVPSIYLAVCYRSDFIRSYFGSTYRGTRLHYSVETQPLGTGGALANCFRQYDLASALVINGDTLFCINLKSFVAAHVTATSRITLALCRVTDTSRYGTVVCDANNRVIAFEEKHPGNTHGLINGGVYVVERSILEPFAPGIHFSLEHDLLQRQVAELRPLGVISDDYFIDIGVPEDLARARNDFAK